MPLRRELGALDAAAIIVSNVIGVGIFTTPGIIASIAPSPLVIFAVWIAGGVMALIGAMAYAELATARPRAGAEYVYLREAYGPLAGFLTGWVSFIAGFSGAIAAGAVGLMAYLEPFFPAAANSTAWLAVPLGPFALTVSPRALSAITIIAVLALSHAVGLRIGAATLSGLAALQLIALTAFLIAGMMGGRIAVADAPPAATAVGLSAFLLALVPVMFSYSGWNAAAYVAEEIREPARSIAPAFALGTTVVIVLYLAINALYLTVLGAEGMAGVIAVGDAVAREAFGSGAAAAVALITAVVILSSLSAMTLAGPRVYFAMSRDGLFFRFASRVHPRFGTPAAAIAAQTVWCALLILSGTFEQLLTYTGFLIIVFAAVAVSAVFRFRRRDSPAPFRMRGYPVTPLLFLAVSALVAVNAILREPGPAGAGAVLTLAGVPLYWLFRGARRRSGRAQNG